MKKATSLFLLLVSLGYGLAFADDVGSPQPINEPAPRFFYPSDPEYRVVSYSVSNSRQDLLTMDVYGNGRVLFHRPKGYIDPGGYEIEMSYRELEDLLTFLADRGIMGMSSQDVEELQRRALVEAAAEGIMPGTSSEARTTISIRLDRYVSREGESFENVDREMSFGPIDHIVRFYPKAAELRMLDEVVRRFLELQQRYKSAMR